jgi:hypothetical protein
MIAPIMDAQPHDRRDGLDRWLVRGLLCVATDSAHQTAILRDASRFAGCRDHTTMPW